MSYRSLSLSMAILHHEMHSCIYSVPGSAAEYWYRHFYIQPYIERHIDLSLSLSLSQYFYHEIVLLCIFSLPGSAAEETRAPRWNIYMFMYIYIRRYIYVYICIYMFIHISIDLYTYSFTYSDTYTSLSIYANNITSRSLSLYL